MTPRPGASSRRRLAVRFARNLCDDIEFSPEDGYRSDPDFLCRVLEAVIAEGATTINIPDTVGYAVPELYGDFIRDLRERIPNSDKAVWSVHCHNDLGMAVANSLAGVKIGGARQVECTINGLGERAGNCSLEEVVMAVRTRARLLRPRARHRHDADRAGLAPGRADHRLRRAAEQGGGRRQRLRARLRHPPGRRAEGARHLRDHARRGRRLGRQQDRAGQALGPQRLQAAPAGARHRAGVRGRRQRRVRALQGAGRPQERDLRRGHHRAGERRERRPPSTSTTGCSRCRSTPRPASGRTPASRSRSATPSTTPRATATARSTPA